MTARLREAEGVATLTEIGPWGKGLGLGRRGWDTLFQTLALRYTGVFKWKRLLGG